MAEHLSPNTRDRLPYEGWHKPNDIAEHPAVIELREHAKRLGLMFKIEGFPFGADYETHLETLKDLPREDGFGNPLN